MEFADPVYLVELEIYETYHAGAVHRISALNPQGTWVVIWTGEQTLIESSRIFKPSPLTPCPFPVNVIKLDLDCSGKWCQIDAVKLIGNKVNFLKRCHFHSFSSPLSIAAKIVIVLENNPCGVKFK